ncbi:SHOCT domain-containing protein [Bradyrhizobium sp. 191]|uniref:SHOCT domain-containing protein n=1 Tax=Bradyrhizobium sp. 191 TaxID=2782659 RepID=UPI0020002FE7|nr:SHOCT domain-containing protein [Bradyrhizobium sp. 191]UPJ63833.1 SHOCT domain-containing protein [Bradyrhizobium sp. 191]
MMYGWWDGSPAPWYGMIFGPIMMIVFVVLTVLIIAWALRALGLGWQSGTQGRDTPLNTLKHRFARGEIDRAEYEDRRRLLSDS